MKLEIQGNPIHPDKRTLYIHQSDIDTFRKCPEQVRLGLRDEYYDPDSDAAFIGTCTHFFIEQCLWHYKENHEWPPADRLLSLLNESKDMLARAWDNLWHHPHQIENLDQGLTMLQNCINLWFNQVVPQLDTSRPDLWLIEHPFDIDIWESPAGQSEIRLRGHVDFFDGYRVLDWKTKDVKPYKDGTGFRDSWKSERYDIQSTVYTWAMSQVFGADPVTDFVLWFTPRTGAQAVSLPLHRGPDAWHMMIEEAKAIGRMALNLKTEHPWPLGPTDWWCSERWCSEHARGRCMGKSNPIYPDEAVYLTDLIARGVQPARHDSTFDKDGAGE